MILRRVLSHFPVTPAIAAALALICTGCSDRSANMSAAATPITTVAAAEAQPETDSGKGNGFTFQIVYPALAAEWKPLDVAIRQFAAARKKEFMEASTAAERVSGAEYSLDLTFTVARRTADFVSVTASGSSFVGGAHGKPIVSSFNLDLSNRKLTTLSDLFTDAQAGLKALSDECRHQLEGRYEAKMRDDSGAVTAAQQAADFESMRLRVEKGTEPTTGNFAVFLIDGLDTRAIGVTVIFPPYQVAPYVDGTQQVEVPAKVFYDLLKPEYKDAFAIDTEANKPAQGVR